MPCEPLCDKPAGAAQRAVWHVAGDAIRTAQRCPSLRHDQFDVAGTISGNWWPAKLPAGSQSVAGDESGGAAFVADNINPSIPVISLGDDIPGIPTGRYVPAAGTPAFISIQYSVTPQVFCFSNLGGAPSPNQILLVSMTAVDQLRIEGQNGTCSPTPSFSSQALTMYR